MEKKTLLKEFNSSWLLNMSETVAPNGEAFSGGKFVLSPVVSSIEPFKCILNMKCRREKAEMPFELA